MLGSTRLINSFKTKARYFIGASLLSCTILSGHAQAELIITDLGISTANGALSVDVNNDGINDFTIEVYEDNSTQDYSAVGWSNTDIESPYNISGSSKNLLNFAMISFDIFRFKAGSTIDANWSGGWNLFGSIYAVSNGVKNGGLWSDIGSTGFLGFAYEETDGTHYGWLELTRGSVNLGRMGYQTVAGQGATIIFDNSGGQTSAPVPEPASGFLVLLASMAMAWRRYS